MTKPAKKTTARKPPAKKKPPAKAKQPKIDQDLSAKAKEFAEQKSALAADIVGSGHNADPEALEKLMGYFGELANIQKSITLHTGEKGAKVKSILNEEQWNRWAFQQIRKLHEMPQTSRSDALRTLLTLLNLMLSHKWHEELRDLTSVMEAEANPEDTGEDDDAEKKAEPKADAEAAKGNVVMMTESFEDDGK